MARKDNWVDINKVIEGDNSSNEFSEARIRSYYNARLRYHKKFLKDKEAAEKAAQKDLEKLLTDTHKLSLREQAEYWREQSKQADAFGDKLRNNLKAASSEFKQNLIDTASKTVKNLTSGAQKEVQSYIDVYDKYMSSIEARIQGSDKSFTDFTNTIKSAIGSSQYISQTKVLEKLANLVEQGILYNVEQRAFLGTISEKIATTFDAANGTLLQLIRIQQADTTAARLGIEASLTRFLNQTFADTSYLSDTFKSVSAALLGASSQLGREGSVEFEYVVQKWLGSLGSVGVSSSTLQTIAQGLNYLGTGDVSALSSNESLQRLLVAAASRSGVDYASMLTGGITPADANKLLQGVVSFGQEIARSNNQVVKSQYAQLFGLTISDMTALLNLSSTDLVNISKNMLTYAGTIKETENQLTEVPGRLHLSERINNLISNTMASVGASIANNAGLYTTWTIASMIESATGGIGIPSVMGFDLNQTVEGLLKTAIIGGNIIAEIPGIISGLGGANNLSLSAWGGTPTTIRGTGFTGIRQGTYAGTSLTGYIGDTSADIGMEAVKSAEEAAIEKKSGVETDLTVDLLKEIYRILDRVSNYGGDRIRVDTEESGYTTVGTRDTYLFGL